MKKFVILLFAVLLLCLSACAEDTPSAVQPTGQPTVTQREPEEVKVETCVYFEQVRQQIDTMDDPSMELPFLSSEKAFRQYGSIIHFSGKAEVYIERSVGYPFAVLSAQTRANPFAVFRSLVKSGLFVPNEYMEDRERFFSYGTNAPYTPYELNAAALNVGAKNYEYSKEGGLRFLQDLQTLSSCNYGALHTLSDRNGDQKIVNDIYYSQDDGCYYLYTMYYRESYMYATALYLRSGDGENITDVGFQLLDIQFPYGNYAAGVSMSTGFYSESVRFEVISLMTAIEQLLTGDCYFNSTDFPSDHAELQYTVPAEYEIGAFSVQFDNRYYLSVDNDNIGADFCDSVVTYSYRISR